MISGEERRTQLPFSEEYRPSYGVHRWTLLDGTKVTGVSAATWADFKSSLQQITQSDTLVVSPELIIEADLDAQSINPELINSRIGELSQISTAFPDTIFLVGTPVYDQDQNLPTNSMLMIKDGKQIGRVNKRTAASPEEFGAYHLIAEEKPTLIPGTSIGVLICSDLPTSTLYLFGEILTDHVLSELGKSNLIGTHPEFIPPQATSLIVPSCWSSGGNGHLTSQNLDRYYQVNLRNISGRILRKTNLLQIAVVDRLPLDEPPEKTPKQPFNALFTKNNAS
jgi:hypothetical protein